MVTFWLCYVVVFLSYVILMFMQCVGVHDVWCSCRVLFVLSFVVCLYSFCVGVWCFGLVCIRFGLVCDVCCLDV